jgi:NAD(P)-dependent dehydrogenase (short-subunit alcohol dehydrogenase family)
MSLSTKAMVAVVTGGASGLGLATTKKFVAQNIKTIIVGRNEANLKQTADELGELCSYKVCDLSDLTFIPALVKEIEAEFGTIDILVNNAGVMSDSSIVKMSDDLWDEAININLTAAFKLIRACAPSMVSKKWGRVINISSQVALTGSANHAHYATAKAGLLGLTYSAAKEYGASGVTVNAVLPGRIETKMIADRSVGRLDEWLAQTPLNRLGRADEVAPMINFLASEGSSYITGAAINVNGGLVMG